MKKTPFDWNRFWTVQLHQVLLGVCAYFISFVILWVIYRIGSPEIYQWLNDFLSVHIMLFALMFPMARSFLDWGFPPLIYFSIGPLNIVYYLYWYRKKYTDEQWIDFLIPIVLSLFLIVPILLVMVIKSLTFEPIPTTY